MWIMTVTPPTLVYISFCLELQLFVRHCCRLGTNKNIVPYFLVQKIRQLASSTWLNLCKTCGFFFFGRYFAFEITDPVIVCDVQLLGLQLRHQYTQMLCFLAVMGKTLVMCVRDTERLLLLMMVLLSMLVLQNDGHT